MDIFEPRQGASLLETLGDSLPNRNLISWRADSNRSQYVHPGFGPNAGPQQPASTDVEEFLRRRLMPPKGRQGGDSVDVMFAGADRANSEELRALQNLLARVQSGRTAKGQLEAQKPLTQIFDAAAEYDKLGKARPDVRPDNSGYWMWQAADRYDREKGWVPSATKGDAARLIFDIDRQAGADRRVDLDKLLSFAREEVAGKNLTEQEKFDRTLAPINAQIPSAMEADLTKSMSKQGLELGKAQARAQLAAAKAGSESKVDEVMRYAAKMLRAGDIKPEEFVNLEKSLIGLGGKTTTPTYSGDKLYADTLASLQSSKIGGKIAVPPEIAHQVAMGVATGKIDPTNPMAYAEQLYRRGIK